MSPREREWHVTVRVAPADLQQIVVMPDGLSLAGLPVLAIEEVTPGGWTRRLPDEPWPPSATAAKRRIAELLAREADAEEETGGRGAGS